jgi:hypothetical protein
MKRWISQNARARIFQLLLPGLYTMNLHFRNVPTLPSELDTEMSIRKQTSTKLIGLCKKSAGQISIPE